MTTPNPNPNLPTRKVGVSTAVGALTVVLVWIAGSLGVVVPEVVASAVTVILASIAGYMVPERDL
ncbi:Mg/Co/Ni transporter MgtE [Actinokineospora baliensis]|uniref:hypothetical protein n=1 Tax=Actinokineospora baliensis TaxID=547056 RepID=UPI00195CFC2C|nr:hypothetical protein [Actinokineospora baliensis]MBM7771987.1 Mg/Co/Ni transporter MgtE [Actinokineospora baliensis]